ncbi:hypothetical protein AKJ09_01016 [Labilithrix luteola]|uniref:Uncharacterized protein n=1 Tax=Labilithrix luteola TaxID=1391654 RepID=A0A0K1PLF1_9BACT|nr:hypothetical protein AKJ09_01016 [Labilithrix luteola]
MCCRAAPRELSPDDHPISCREATLFREATAKRSNRLQGTRRGWPNK